jgi:hypothetical protein
VGEHVEQQDDAHHAFVVVPGCLDEPGVHLRIDATERVRRPPVRDVVASEAI